MLLLSTETPFLLQKLKKMSSWDQYKFVATKNVWVFVEVGLTVIYIKKHRLVTKILWVNVNTEISFFTLQQTFLRTSNLLWRFYTISYCLLVWKCEINTNDKGFFSSLKKNSSKNTYPFTHNPYSKFSKHQTPNCYIKSICMKLNLHYWSPLHK